MISLSSLARWFPLACIAALSTQAAELVGPDPAQAEQVVETPPAVLFIGNSFTFAADSAVRVYRPETVTDLNKEGIGGVPALFKLLTEQAGLAYEVSLETSPGKTLQWHWQNRRDVLDRPWDHVVLQEFSTLDPQAPGEPAKMIAYSGRFAKLFHARNPAVDISLTSTWTRADLVYRVEGAWSGTAISRMATDLRAAADEARAAHPRIARVNPVGEAFNCAMEAGYADPNPFDGRDYDKVDLWAHDHYHASVAGSYLQALVLFGSITGQDPRQFGMGEIGAEELGLSDRQAMRLQAAAWATLQGEDCTTLPAEPGT